MLREKRRGRKTNRRRIAALSLLVIAFMFFSAVSPLSQPGNSGLGSEQPSGSNPQANLAPPSTMSGFGSNMSLTESMNAFEVSDLNTTNYFRAPSYVVGSFNDTSSAESVSGYTRIWQNVTIKDITAENEYRKIQDGTTTVGYLGCGQGGSPYWRTATINFTTTNRINLTAVWIYYEAAQGGGFLDPPAIQLTINTDSNGHPSGTILGNGTVQPLGLGWRKINVAKDGNPINLAPDQPYWLVMNGSTIPTGPESGYYGYYKWRVAVDGNPNYNYTCVVAENGGAWTYEKNIFGAGRNLLSVLLVKAVDESYNTKTYSSPTQVDMKLNGTAITADTTSVNATKVLFNFTTSYSVTFTVNWTARFEHSRDTVVSTHYVAREGYTDWNANFTSDSKPSNPCAWYNKTFRVSPIPSFWNGTSNPPAVWNNRSYASGFTNGSGYYLVNQTNHLNDPWNSDWGISVKSLYSVKATAPLTVIRGLPLTINISTQPLSQSHCNITFFEDDNLVSSTMVYIPQTFYLFNVSRFNETDTHTVFLFDTWDNGNEVSLNSTLTIDVTAPNSNVTLTDLSDPVIWGNNASAKFKFFNNSDPIHEAEVPEHVYVNGTETTWTLVSGDEYSTTWNTTLSVSTGDWRPGDNGVNITVESGVFINYTVDQFEIIQPTAKLLLNRTSYAATYGDDVNVSFKLLNTTLGDYSPIPDPTLYLNGTGASYVPWGEWYNYTLNVVEPEFDSARIWGLNFTARYGRYVAANLTSIDVSKLPMNVAITECQNAVLPYSYLPVTADLTYQNNGSGVQDGFTLRFNFTITYIDDSSGSIVRYESTSGGAATYSLLAESDMKSIVVRVSYAGDPIRDAAYDEQTGIEVPPLLTQISLENATMSATWSEKILIRVMFQNATQGEVNGFPSTPLPVFNLSYPGGYVVPSLLDEGDGSYSFNYSTSLLSSAGSKLLNITATYQGIYVNVTTLTLELEKLPMIVHISSRQTSVNVGSSLVVTTSLQFRNGTLVPDGYSVRFDFAVTYANGTATVTKYGITSGGNATANLLAASGMQSMNVTATYEGSAVLDTKTSDEKVSIPVTVPAGLPIILLIGSVAGGSILVILPLAMRARRRTGKAKEARKVSRLTEAASLAQLVVVHLASGRSVYSKSLGAEESVDPQLISGFLTANQAVLGEAFKRKAGATLKSADYGEYKVISHVGRYVMATLFCTETPGKELQTTLQEFTRKFEDKYADTLVSWDGDMSAFKDAEEIAAEAFALSLVCPYMIDEEAVSQVKLSGIETKILRLATRLSVERGGVFFLPRIIDYLITREKMKKSKASDIIAAIGKKGIFKQLTLDEAENLMKQRAATNDAA